MRLFTIGDLHLSFGVPDKPITRLTPDTAASPTEDTIRVSARPMVTLSACSAISGSSSATSACRGNRGVDVNLDDFMLSSVVNDKSSNTPIIQRMLSKCKCCIQ